MYGHPHALLDIARRLQQELLDDAERARIRKGLRRRVVSDDTAIQRVPRLRLVPEPTDEAHPRSAALREHPVVKIRPEISA